MGCANSLTCVDAHSERPCDAQQFVAQARTYLDEIKNPSDAARIREDLQSVSETAATVEDEITP